MNFMNENRHSGTITGCKSSSCPAEQRIYRVTEGCCFNNKELLHLSFKLKKQPGRIFRRKYPSWQPGQVVCVLNQKRISRSVLMAAWPDTFI